MVGPCSIRLWTPVRVAESASFSCQEKKLLSRVVRGFLYGIQTHDAFTFAVVPILLAVVALVACWIPARRASLVDPAETLRAE